MILLIFYPAYMTMKKKKNKVKILLLICSVFWPGKSNDHRAATDHVVVVLVAVGAVVTDSGDATEGSTRLCSNTTISSNLFKQAHVVVAVWGKFLKGWCNSIGQFLTNQIKIKLFTPVF